MSTVNMAYVSLVILAIFVNSGCSIRCFQCSSFQDPECGDLQPNDTSSPFLNDCESKVNPETQENYQMFCRKSVQIILDGDQPPRITRSCGWLYYKQNISICQVTDTDFKMETACQCFTEACNGGTVLTPVGNVAMTLILVFFGRLILS